MTLPERHCYAPSAAFLTEDGTEPCPKCTPLRTAFPLWPHPTWLIFLIPNFQRWRQWSKMVCPRHHHGYDAGLERKASGSEAWALLRGGTCPSSLFLRVDRVSLWALIAGSKSSLCLCELYQLTLAVTEAIRRELQWKAQSSRVQDLSSCPGSVPDLM